jgi:sugar-specific transcriptional regulator TrmB
MGKDVIEADDDIQTLQELGLTLSQAKVYATAVKLGYAKAKDLWKKSGVGRQEVYRILAELLDKNLIEKEVSTPTQFRPVPLSKGVQTLLNRKREELHRVSLKARDFVSRNKKAEKIKTPESHFLILSRKHLAENRSGDSYKNARNTIEYLSLFKRFSDAFAFEIDLYEDVVERGVQMKIVTETLDACQCERLEQIAANLLRKKNFKVRFADQIDKTVAFSIIDGKEAYFPLNPDKQLSEDQTLWTNNAALVSLAENYFKIIWRGARSRELMQ